MIVGIDIGTSYSSVCILGQDGKGQPVDVSTGASIYGGKYSLPSAVFVEESGNILVGQAAMNSRKRKPQNFRMEFKRDLGQNIPILLGERSFLPEELYTELFRHMKTCAEKCGREPIQKAYLTCPASFGGKKKEKITEAARAAGLFQTELVDEPTAAAMGYLKAGMVREGETLLIYDFGGGTFDVSLLRYEKDNFTLLAEPEGLDHCGGIDIDRMIWQDLLKTVGEELLRKAGENPVNRMRLESQLAEMAVKAKHHLSSADIFEEDIQVGFDLLPYRLTRDRLNCMMAPLLEQTIEACRAILVSAEIKLSDLSSVLLVGGSSRIPLVQQLVRRFAGGAPVYSTVDLELAVACGAAVFRKREIRKEKAELPRRMAEPPRIRKIPAEVELLTQIRESDIHREIEKALAGQKKRKQMLEKKITAEEPAAPMSVAKAEETYPEEHKKSAGEAGNPKREAWKNVCRSRCAQILCGEGMYGLTAVRWDGTVETEDFAVRNTGGEWRDLKALASGEYTILGLRNDGTAVAQSLLPSIYVGGWTELTALGCGEDYALGLRRDGRVLCTGKNAGIRTATAHWRDMAVICCGASHAVGLRKDGTAAAAGKNESGQCRVNGWEHVISVACGAAHTVGLRKDGTVAAAGDNKYGQCQVQEWSGIVAVACGDCHTVGLRKDGTVMAAGRNEYGQCKVEEWREVTAVACGYGHTAGLTRSGRVMAAGGNYYGQCCVDSWDRVIALTALPKRTAAVREDGTVFCTDNTAASSKHLGWKLF